MNLARIRRWLALTFVGALLIGAAQAQVVNISTTKENNPVNFVDPLVPGIIDSGYTLHLGPGTYVITPVDESFAGAAYTAALRFATVDAPSTGFEWNFWLAIGNAPGVKYGFGEGIPAQGGTYQSTAAGAFALAPGPVTFTLASATDITLYWRDDNWGDNSGGISLYVSAVPEPGTLALMLAGMGLLGWRGRRRS